MESFLPEIPFLPVNAAGQYGEQVDGLLNLVTYIITPWTILTFGVIFLFCIIYRRGTDRTVPYVDSHQTLFTIGSIPIPRTAIVEIPTLMVLGLDLWIFFSSVVVWGDIKIDQPEPDAQIQVVGKQFGWDFYYPGENGELDTEINRTIKRRRYNGKDQSKRVVEVQEGDDELTGGMVVRAGDTVALKITSKDVIHSLFLPNLRFKQDAVPGRNIDAWLRAVKPTRPTYLEGQILNHLESALSTAKEQASGDSAKQHVQKMQSSYETIRDQFDIDGEVPNYSSLESEYRTFKEHAQQLPEYESGKEGEKKSIKNQLGSVSQFFNIIQSNSKPYFRKESYTIACTELCGTGHSGMVAELRVLPDVEELDSTYEKLVTGKLNYSTYFLQ